MIWAWRTQLGRLGKPLAGAILKTHCALPVCCPFARDQLRKGSTDATVRPSPEALSMYLHPDLGPPTSGWCSADTRSEF